MSNVSQFSKEAPECREGQEIPKLKEDIDWENVINTAEINIATICIKDKESKNIEHMLFENVMEKISGNGIIQNAQDNHIKR